MPMILNLLALRQRSFKQYTSGKKRPIQTITHGFTWPLQQEHKERYVLLHSQSTDGLQLPQGFDRSQMRMQFAGVDVWGEEAVCRLA